MGGRPTWGIDRCKQRHRIWREAEALHHSSTVELGRTNASSPALSPVSSIFIKQIRNLSF